MYLELGIAGLRTLESYMAEDKVVSNISLHK
jgi:hypothetical protein